MIIGIPKEVKEFEYRVGATPALVNSLVQAGHKVLVEEGAGIGAGYPDALYREIGALIASRSDVFSSEMIVKVKELQSSEYHFLKEGQLLFCFLHLAPDPKQTAALLEKKIIGIAFETVTDSEGRLPLLTPMSEIAGRQAVQVGACALQMNNGGKGVLLGGVPGVHPAHVVILGGGVVGTEAARMAMGLGASVRIFDSNINRLRALDLRFGPNLKTLYSNSYEIEKACIEADLLIGAVLVAGKRAPRLVTREILGRMEPGSVFVDVAIDQGGSAETSRPTTHGNPTYIEEGVIHYCVTNMPGASARTATQSLSNAIGPYVLAVANKGWRQALSDDPGLLSGLNVCLGSVTHPEVAHDLGYSFVPPVRLL